MILPANDGLKPGIWNVQQGLVAPEWRWFWTSIVVACPLWENNGPANIFDVAGRRYGVWQGAASPWSVGPLGPEIKFAGSSTSWYNFGDLHDFPTAAFEFVSLRKVSSSTGNRGTFTKWNHGSQETMIIRQNGGQQICFIADSLTDVGDNRVETQSAVPYFSAGDEAMFFCSYDGKDSGGNKGKIKMFRYKYGGAGLEEAATNDFGTIPSSMIVSTANVEFGALSSLSQYQDSNFRAIYFFKKRLTNAERVQLARDPFGPIRIAEQPVAAFVPAAAAVAATRVIGAADAYGPQFVRW